MKKPAVIYPWLCLIRLASKCEFSITEQLRIARLIGVEYDNTPALAATALIDRYSTVLDAAMRFAAQIPGANMDDLLPHRNRSYLTLINHLVQIPHDFLAITTGESLTGKRAASLPEVNKSMQQLDGYCSEAKMGLQAWLAQSGAVELSRTVETYFGDQTLHQVLERCVWHSAQHARQLIMVLELLNIQVNSPLTSKDFVDLPMPVDVWDG